MYFDEESAHEQTPNADRLCRCETQTYMLQVRMAQVNRVELCELSLIHI